MNNIKPRDMDVYEILNKLVLIKDRSNKVEWLKTNFEDHVPLLRIVKMNFCNTIISVLPEGEPPFNKEETDGPTPASLWQYVKHFPVFVRSAQSSKMRMVQIEKLFIEMLEALEPKEAELVCLAKDRQLQSRWDIDAQLFIDAFPSLNIQTAKIEVKQVTTEDKIENLLQTAKEYKVKSKELLDEAKKFEKEAKELAKTLENDDAASAAG